MASTHRPWLSEFSRWLPSWMSVFLLWLIMLLAPVHGQMNRSNEVQILTTFKTWSTLQDSQEDAMLSGVLQPGGFWDSWKEGDLNPCAWVGVTCTSNYTVEQLDLSGWGLTSVPSVAFKTLSSLPDLRQLDLSKNNLGSDGSHFPVDVGSLTQLTWLDLSENFYDDEFPVTITDCKSLRFLSLAQNRLSGAIPNMSALADLQVLSLGDNRLFGLFPKDLGEVSSLVCVDFSGNRLNGTIPSLSNLTNLLELKLDDNNFRGFEEPQVPIAKKLTQLYISGNRLEGPLPPSITSMTNLQVLNMSNNRLTGEIPAGLGLQANHSFWLDLSQNLLSGKIPAELLYSTPNGQLASLNLSHNSFSGRIPIPLDGGEERFNYDVLDLSYNHLSGPIPFISKNASTQILSLCLQNNMLEGDVVDLLVNGSGFGLSNELQLQNNLFVGDLSRMVNSWSNFSQLQVLDLRNNNIQMSITEAIPDPLRSTLESFVSTSCTNCVVMREFLLGGNNFTGVFLPVGYTSGLLPNQFLQSLHVSKSNLQGQISGATFNSTWLPALKSLNLSNNEITGNIPEITLQLPNLVVLNVSNNKMSGRLPALQSSSYLYNPSLFTGNALCGDPLPPCPGKNGIQWWVYLIIGLSVIIAMGSCLAATWRWRVYRKRHEQDADLIKALMEKDSATLMSLGELKRAANNFAESAQIGEGGFGVVYKGKLIDGTRVAIKRSKREGSEDYKAQFLNEVKILSQVNHRNLVKLLGCCMENKIALLVFEFVSNGSLQEHLQGTVDGAIRLTWKQRLDIATQTADALNYLHSATTFPIYHRDVKSANILLTDDLSAKVADFGISKLAPAEATHVSTFAIQGTRGYIDPEYFLSYQLTNKSDVYSFGVVLLELISAKPPIDFNRSGDETSLLAFANPLVESGDLERLVDPALMETYNDPAGRESILNVGKLAMRCLDMRSRARPTMNEVSIALRTLLVELYGTSKQLDSIDEDDNIQDLRIDDTIAIQMPQFSLQTEYDFMVNEGGILKPKIISPSSDTMFHRSRSFQHSNGGA